jgi:hypothetical protein
MDLLAVRAKYLPFALHGQGPDEQVPHNVKSEGSKNPENLFPTYIFRFTVFPVRQLKTLAF